MGQKKPKYVGSMFVETKGGVVEIGMMGFPDGDVVPGGVRDAVTFRRPKVLPSKKQVQTALRLARWCSRNEIVFEGVVSYADKPRPNENLN